MDVTRTKGEPASVMHSATRPQISCRVSCSRRTRSARDDDDDDEMATASTEGSHAAYLSTTPPPSTTLLLAPELWTLLLDQLNTQDPVEPTQLSVAVSARYPTASVGTKAAKSLSSLVVFARQADTSFLRNLGKDVRCSSSFASLRGAC